MSEEDVIIRFILFFKNANRNQNEEEIVELTETEKEWVNLFISGDD